MDQALKQRLVGAMVVIAALVVAIPAFLGGERGAERPRAVKIPLAPAPETQTRLLPLNDTDSAGVDGPSLQVQAQPVLAPPPGEGDTPVVGGARPEPEILATEPELADAPNRARAATTAAESSMGARLGSGKQGHDTRPAGDSPRVGFSVQLGGFSKQKNALSLQSMLRKAGYDAYVEAIQRGAKTLYRVRVGPRLHRADAQILLQQIRKKIGMDGIIVPAS